MNELRIGICGCTTAYHGQLEGKELCVTKLTGVTLDQPVKFTIKEVAIPEHAQNSTQVRSRSHVFVDVHNACTHNQNVRVFIRLLDYVPRRKGHIKLKRLLTNFWKRPSWEIIQRLGLPSWKIRYAFDILGWEQTVRELPSPDELIRQMERTLAKMDANYFYGWLFHLTPPFELDGVISGKNIASVKADSISHRKKVLGQYHCLPVCSECC